MTLQSTLLAAASTAAFIAAASAAKAYTLSPGWGWLAATLALYTLGNLIMLRLIGNLGMGVALRGSSAGPLTVSVARPAATAALCPP